MNKSKLCDNCNSEVIVIKRGNRFVAECSYCGEVAEEGYIIGDFLSEHESDE